MSQPWSAREAGEFLERLARVGRYLFNDHPSIRAMARAFGYHQQTFAYWKTARREPPMFREFLRRYAREHHCDERALLERWEVMPAASVAESRAEYGQPKDRLEEFAGRLTNSPDLLEIQQKAPGFFEREWLPQEQEILQRARTEIDTVIARAEADLNRLRLMTVRLWNVERRKSR